MDLSFILEIVIFLLIVSSCVYSFFLAQQIGKGVLNIIFYSFSAGTLMVGLSRLFLFMSDQGLYKLEDVTLHVWWHLIFYMGMIAFIWGGKRLKDISSSTTPTGFTSKDGMVLGSMVALSIAIFFLAPVLENSLAPLLVGSVIDKFGLHHFIAFILAGIDVWYLYNIKANWGQLLTVSVYPTLFFLGLMGLQHFWELVTESLKVIIIEPESGELVEKFIVLPAIALLLYGLFQVGKVIKAQTMPTPAANATTTTT